MAADGYILAVDYGDVRVGLAVGHSVARLPRPLCTLQNGPDLISNIMTATTEKPLLGLVVGLPRNMDGTLGPQAVKCQTFGEDLASRLQLPVTYVEETLSTVEAEQYMQDSGAKAAGLDAAAAACILERYFVEVTAA